MRSLKAFLVFVGLVVVATGLIVPGVWLYTAASLPSTIDSAMDIETHLRQSIESERHGMQLPLAPRLRKPVKWERPDPTRLPKRLVTLFTTETGCPTYFQTPRETGLSWKRRVWTKLLTGNDVEGDGACELIFARTLARRLGAKSPLQQAVAADRIHRFLLKDELVSFNLMSMQFEPGLIGVEDAAVDVMGKPLSQLSDAELAELQLAIPPWGYWEDIKLCRNAGLLREARDVLLRRLAEQGLISVEMARSAQAQPVRCLSVQR